MQTSAPELLALILLTVHFGVPLLYYWYLKTRWLSKPWNVEVDPSYKPKVSIILPTYMGAKWISQRLDNIRGQDYPHEKIEVIVVDSNSPDGTSGIVKEWVSRHRDINVKLIIEPVRRGKLSAVMEGLRHVSRDSEVVILTDDDCLWDKSALKNAVKYFADPTVGAVTGSIMYLNDNGSGNVYRSFYNKVRIGESKWWATPVANGPLLAMRKNIIDEIGLPTFPGADDSAFASYIAFAGYRAIQADDVLVYEARTPKQHARMLRRALHLVSYFTYMKRYARLMGVYRRTPFDRIWAIEGYLHVVNPWLLAASTLLLIALAAGGSMPALMILTMGLLLLLYKPFRVWVASQGYLATAMFKRIKSREAKWSR
jgi:cellulose synthase/poly-beta-1,6-N-acetylglucosamine synthase-like glycosyltransferase